MVLVCDRCARDHDVPAWVRGVRRWIYQLTRRESVTVIMSDCTRTCPAGRIAMLLLTPTEGCLEWAVPPDHDQRAVAESLLAAIDDLDEPCGSARRGVGQ